MCILHHKIKNKNVLLKVRQVAYLSFSYKRILVLTDFWMWGLVFAYSNDQLEVTAQTLLKSAIWWQRDIKKHFCKYSDLPQTLLKLSTKHKILRLDSHKHLLCVKKKCSPGDRHHRGPCQNDPVCWRGKNKKKRMVKHMWYMLACIPGGLLYWAPYFCSLPQDHHGWR